MRRGCPACLAKSGIGEVVGRGGRHLECRDCRLHQFLLPSGVFRRESLAALPLNCVFWRAALVHLLGNVWVGGMVRVNHG